MNCPVTFRVVKFITAMTLASLLFRVSLSQDLIWQRTNGPYGGRIFALGNCKNGILVAGSENCGIYRSTDDGESWQQTSLSSETIKAFAFDSKGRIFAGSYSASGVYASADSGLTWVKANAGMSNQGVECLVVSAKDHIYAGTFYSSLFRSTDAGASWSRLLLPFIVDGVFPVRSICTDSNGNIYAGVDRKGVYRSTDDGETWRLIGFDGGNVKSLMCPVAGEIVAGINRTVYRSTDGGATWLQLGLSIGWITLMGTDARGNIFAFTDDGLYRLSRGAADWDRVDVCVNSTRFLSGMISPKGYVFAGTDGDGIARSRDKGTTWEETNTGITGMEVSTLATSSNGILLAGTNRGLFVTTDKGSSWNLTSILPGPVRDIQVVSDMLILAATRVGIFKSNDNGVNWSKVYQAPSLTAVNSLCADSSKNIYAAISTGQICRSTDFGENWSQVFDTKHYNYALVAGRGGIYAGTEYYGIYRSTDHGITWIPVNDGIVDGLSERTIFCLGAMQNGDIYAGTPRQLLRSTDGGNYWKSAMDSAVYCWSIVEGEDEVIYVGSRREVFYSSNHGLTWRVSGNSLSGDIVSALTFDRDGYLYAGMVYGGVFRTAQKVITELPRTFQLFQNYPNPFNESTIVEFLLPYEASAELKIYNVLGQEIETLVSGRLRPGRHAMRWNASISSGIYFYRFRSRPTSNGQSEEYSETRKMILLH